MRERDSGTGQILSSMWYMSWIFGRVDSTGDVQGDEAAQAELYNRTYSDVYFTILSITKDEDLIMDMVQDTYLTAFRKLEQLKDSDSFCAWLKRIAHNRTLNALRDRRVLHTATTISTETEVVLEIEDDRIKSLPEASMDQKETSRLVREILDALPEDQRIVVGMYYYDQLSVSEIAEELECSENTVKSRLNYGRKKIQGKVLELEKKGQSFTILHLCHFLSVCLEICINSRMKKCSRLYDRRLHVIIS